MKKRTITIVILILSIGLSYFYFNHIYGWKGFHGNGGTPKEYLTPLIINREGYTLDSIEILRQLRLMLAKHEDFFSNTAHSESTKLIVDSILYSPDLNKLAVFVIARNSTSKMLDPNKNYKWYYDATCYLGVRENDRISLSWIGPTFTNSYDIEKISNEIRVTFFKRNASSDLTNARSYNLDDIRFWSSSIWKEIEKSALEEIEFEKEKKRHPENVYEPK